ncbi:MAG: hypothetical protein R3B59_07195 [Dehalococcoidia bacterium]
MAGALGSLLRRRAAMAAWVALWGVAGALVIVWFMTADEGRPAAAGRTDEEPVAASVRFVRMTAAETVIEVTVTGRPEFARLADSGFATLTDARGEEHPIRTATLDGRTATISFPGLADVTPGQARVEMPRIGLTNDPIDVPDEERHVTYLALEPAVVILAPTAGTSERTDPGASATSEGGYGATVTSIVRDDEGAVISGRLEGFTREEIQSLSLLGTQVVLADGSAALLSGGSYGEGDGLADFSISIRVPRQAELARLELRIDAVVPSMVRVEADAETRARLDRFEARDAFVLSIELGP